MEGARGVPFLGMAGRIFLGLRNIGTAALWRYAAEQWYYFYSEPGSMWPWRIVGYERKALRGRMTEPINGVKERGQCT